MTFSILTPLAGLVLGLSGVLSVLFVLYGFNMLHLTRRAKAYTLPIADGVRGKPDVAVHLPIFDELYVVSRLLESCARMADHYGKNLVRICVIDDSDDETSAEIEREAEQYRKHLYQVEVLRRATRKGFKAGALQAALERTNEPIVAIFDADFEPPPDFLDRTVPHLQGDEKVGFVQTRWTHLDNAYNAITETLALGVDMHFLLEQPGRSSSGYLMNFNGSAGLLRREAIIKAGGWESDTLAEDLDLSYRMQLAGYRAVYLEDVEVPAELPPTIVSFKRQQERWARGSLQTARKLMPAVMASTVLTKRQKFEALVHLTYYLVHPLMVFSFLLALVATFLNIDVINVAVKVTLPRVTLGSQAAYEGLVVAPWVVFGLLIVGSTIAVLFSCVEAVRIQRLNLLRNVKRIILLVIIGYGISISNTGSAFAGLFSRKTGEFTRTPKYAIEGKNGCWRGKKYQMALNRVTALEAFATSAGIAGMFWGLETGNIGIVPILAVYVVGYVSVLTLTLSQTIRSGPRGKFSGMRTTLHTLQNQPRELQRP